MQTVTIRRLVSGDVLLFILFLGGFVFWRHGYPLVWDDTSVYKIAFQAWKVGGREDLLATFLSYIIPAFSQASPSGYRPIGSLLQSFFILTIDSTSPSWGHLIFVGCFVGALAIAFKRIAARFIKSTLVLYTCVVMFMFSSPIAQSSWISYTGVPVLVPLFTCMGLILYFKICESPQPDLRKLWLLAFIVIFASWYREFMIALPITILGMETVRAKRVTRVSLLAAALIFFCLFPTLIPYVLFKIFSVVTGYDMQTSAKDALGNGLLLPLKPVFQLGNVHAQLSGDLAIRGEVSRHLLNIPSPSFLILTFFGFAGLAFVNARRKIGAGRLDGRSASYFVALALGVCALAGMASSRVAGGWSLHPFWPYHLGIVSLLFVAWIVDRRLAIWTAVFLAPFYLVYTERLHLAYVMMPLSIVAAVLLDRCWMAQQSSTKLGTLTRTIAGLAMAIGVLDAWANPLAVRSVMSQVSSGIETVAHKFNKSASDRPVAIIGNALHVDDLRIYLDGSYQILWTVGSGHDRPQDVVETPEQLRKFLQAKLPTTDVYFLDVRHDYLTPEKRLYHQHRFVAGCSAHTDDLGQLHQTKAEYFMPDILRWFTQREYFAFFGPPDLVDDFYYGPSHRIFFGQVDAEYHLYKVTSSDVRNWLPLGRVALIESDFLGFSIVSEGGRVFAIPVREGEFSYERVCRKRYSKSFEATSLDEIKTMIAADQRHVATNAAP